MSEREGIQVFSPDRGCRPGTLGGVWSPVITVPASGRFVFVSGLTSRAEDCSVAHVGDIEAQTRQVCENLVDHLDAVGATLDDVVKLVVYIRDVADFATIHTVRREFWPERSPVSTMVQVESLVDSRSLIEIDATAWLAEPVGEPS